MKKQWYVLLISCITSLVYPLTRQDWNVINSLMIGGASFGAIGGWATGYTAGTAIGHHFAPTVPSTPAELRAYVTSDLPKKRIIRKTIPPIVLAPIGSVGGVHLGLTAGEKLAIIYIARKYGIDRITAWNAIRYNHDLSKLSAHKK